MLLSWISRNIVATQANLPFPFVRVCCCAAQEKELRRGGSQLKRISAPAVRRAIFESPHHLDILNATPRSLYTDLHFQLVLVTSSPRPIPILGRLPTKPSDPSLFHAEEIVDRSPTNEHCLLETYLAEILSLDSGRNGRSSSAIVVVAR